MIINIRGTSGSGKSTLVRMLMAGMVEVKEVRGKQIVTPDPKERLLGYYGYLPPRKSLSVIGSYVNDCGGCDTIKTQAEVCARVNHFSTRGNVVFEGLIVSDIHARYRDLANTFCHAQKISTPKMEEALGRPTPQRPAWVFAFLDTPIDVCLERVKERRARKGNHEPLNPDNTVNRWHTHRRLFDTFTADGFTTVWLPWQDPLPHLMELLT